MQQLMRPPMYSMLLAAHDHLCHRENGTCKISLLIKLILFRIYFKLILVDHEQRRDCHR